MKENFGGSDLGIKQNNFLCLIEKKHNFNICGRVVSHLKVLLLRIPDITEFPKWLDFLNTIIDVYMYLNNLKSWHVL